MTDDDPADLLALGVVGAVGQFSHFHRTGRIDLSLDELSSYVARLAARILTSDEQIARRSLQALRRARVAAVAGSGEPAGNGEPAPDPV